MNLIDIVLGALLIIAFYVGYKKGLFVALAGLIGIVAGVYGAIYFSDFAAGYISQWFDWSEQTVNLAAFAITFLGIVFLISAAGKFLTKIADFAMLGIVNKLLGGLFNTVKYAFMLSVVFMFVNASGSFSILSEEKREASVLYTPIASIAPVIIPHILREADQFRLENRQETSTDPQATTE